MSKLWTMDTAHNKAVVALFDDLGNGGGDLAVLDSLCTPDLVNHALAPRTQGLQGTREFLQEARRDLYPGRWVKSFVVAEGDMVCSSGPESLSGPAEPSSASRHQREPQSATWPLPTGLSMAALPNVGPSAMT